MLDLLHVYVLEYMHIQLKDISTLTFSFVICHQASDKLLKSLFSYFVEKLKKQNKKL